VKKLFLAAVLVALATPMVYAQAPPDSIAAAVEALDWKRQSAMIGFDRAVLDDLLDPYVTYTHSIGLVQTRDQLYEMLASGNVSYKSFTNDGVRWRVFPGVVVGTGTQKIELVVDGKPTSARNRFTVVWRSVGERWKCIAYQSTPVPAVEEKQTFR
jgi:hypothetical protein